MYFSAVGITSILLGVPPLGVYNRNTGENGDFLALCVNIQHVVVNNAQYNSCINRKRYEIRPKLLLMTNRKLHMRFRLAPRSMTMDDVELI